MVVNLQCPHSIIGTYSYTRSIGSPDFAYRKIANLGDTGSKDSAVDGQLLQWTCQSNVGLPSDLRVVNTVTKKTTGSLSKTIINSYNTLQHDTQSIRRIRPLRKPLKDEISPDDPFQWWTFSTTEIMMGSFWGATLQIHLMGLHANIINSSFTCSPGEWPK